jgi:hypothetical protein
MLEGSWSGLATPTETFEDFSDLQNVSDRVANPVTPRAIIIEEDGLFHNWALRQK